MKKIYLLLFSISCTFLHAQSIAFDMLYGNGAPEHYYLGHYPVIASDGLQIKWHGGIRLTTGGDTALQVLGNSNIGIGNIDPTEKLDISGNILLRNIHNSVGAGNTISFSSIGKDYGARIRSSLLFANGSDSKQALILSSFWEGYKDELTLIDGRVGIGTPSPSSTLTVLSNNPAGGSELSLQTQHTRNDTRYFMKNIIQGMGNDDVTFSLRHDAQMFVDGNVGIGVNNPKNKLDVNGTIHSREVKVDLTGWADYVFEKDYRLPTLEEVEKHIKEKGHLMSIPSEKDVVQNGLLLGDNQRLLLQKIEELTLYIIEQNKKIIKLEEQMLNIKSYEN